MPVLDTEEEEIRGIPWLLGIESEGIVVIGKRLEILGLVRSNGDIALILITSSNNGETIIGKGKTSETVEVSEELLAKIVSSGVTEDMG